MGRQQLRVALRPRQVLHGPVRAHSQRKPPVLGRGHPALDQHNAESLLPEERHCPPGQQAARQDHVQLQASIQAQRRHAHGRVQLRRRLQEVRAEVSHGPNAPYPSGDQLVFG